MHGTRTRKGGIAPKVLLRLEALRKGGWLVTASVRRKRRVMTRLPSNYEFYLRLAVKQYWQTLESQSKKQKAKDADRGRRAAVTGGKQMDGFCTLIELLLKENGVPDGSIFLQKGRLEIPGYFRPTKEWDLLVVHEDSLLAAIEFKSQRGPSFGNNLNNRVEESLGNATDLWTAYREGAFGGADPRPWLGWVMLLEDCPESQSSVGVKEPHFEVFEEFRGASYAQRYEILAKKLMMEKLYDRTCLLLATAKGGIKGEFNEASSELTMKKFLRSLAGHVSTHVEG